MRYDFVAILEYYGLGHSEVMYCSNGSNLMVLCPFHKDTKPSLSISLDRSVFNCFGCGASGTAVDFVARYEGLNELEAHRRLLRIRRVYSSAIQGLSRIVSSDTRQIQGRVGVYPIPIWEMIWMRRYIDDPRYYPFRRGILPHTLYEWCVGWDYFDQAVVFHIPYRGVYAGWQKRFVRPRSSKKYLFSPGFRRVGLYWSGEFAPPSDFPLLLVEGPWDALYAYQAGYRNVAALLGSPNQIILSTIPEYAGNGLVVCAFDRDEAGQAYFSRIKAIYPKTVNVDYKVWGDAVDLDEVPPDQLVQSILEVL